MTKILCLNMCLMPPIFGGHNCCKSRIDLLFDNYSSSYDILLLQEVWEFMFSCKCNSRLDYLLDKAKDNGYTYMAYEPRRRFHFVNSGLIILSKYPILKTKQLIYKDTAGLQTIVSNGVLYAKININNSIINVFVTHFHAGTLDTRFMNSHKTYIRVVRNQALELKKFIDSLIDQDILNNKQKYIIAGDFNIDGINDKENLEYLENVLCYKSLMRDLNCPNTYPIPVTGSSLVDPVFINCPSCIDHVFSNIDNKDIAVKVLDMYTKNKYISDHAGLDITF